MELMTALSEYNHKYEKRFGFTSIYINYRLCAKEKSKQFHVLLCVLLHHWV